jgi:hypothetical protein
MFFPLTLEQKITWLVAVSSIGSLLVPVLARLTLSNLERFRAFFIHYPSSVYLILASGGAFNNFVNPFNESTYFQFTVIHLGPSLVCVCVPLTPFSSFPGYNSLMRCCIL